MGLMANSMILAVEHCTSNFQELFLSHIPNLSPLPTQKKKKTIIF